MYATARHVPVPKSQEHLAPIMFLIQEDSPRLRNTKYGKTTSRVIGLAVFRDSVARTGNTPREHSGRSSVVSHHPQCRRIGGAPRHTCVSRWSNVKRGLLYRIVRIAGYMPERREE